MATYQISEDERSLLAAGALAQDLSSPAGAPRLVYRAGVSTLYQVLVVVLLVVLTVAFLGGALLALVVPPRPLVLPAVVAVVMLLLLGGAVVLLLRPAFRVTTEGVEVRGYLSTQRLRWPEVAVVEIDRALLNRGATVVVARDGRRVTSALTGSRFAVFRGESVQDHGPDLMHPARPTCAALDTHRRWLRGEL